MKNIKMIILVILLFQFSWTSSASAEEKTNINLASESAIVIDAKSGFVIYEKNSEHKMYPASITKIVTAIVALEEGNPEDLVVVSENARNVDGTRVYLEEGEVVPLIKLLQGLLINSGNDAGVAIAEHMDGSVEGFADRMNSFVKEKVGVTNTSFKNPHGLFDENHYTTALDMAKITKYALNNEVFTGIISTQSLPWKGESWDTTLYNHHRLLREIPYDGIIGGKNGFVNQSGFTLVTAAQRGETKLIAVTLNSTTKNGQYEDTMALFDYGFENFDPSMVPKVEKPVEKTITVEEPQNEEKKTNEMDNIWIHDGMGFAGEESSSRPHSNLLTIFVSLFFFEILAIFAFAKIRKNNGFNYHK
ncbi:D-alanyl-D-alanine carboxypeptidase family protein [Bacillus sp. DJP31]|uniref:D-alanyl-D-alanine carboxypeptidase family protein n=1 Tax=Bacillus sp. DJP31 TaxID=3409789 RepID=UPI003BB4B217